MERFGGNHHWIVVFVKLICEICNQNGIIFFSIQVHGAKVKNPSLNVWESHSYTTMYFRRVWRLGYASLNLDTKIELCLQSTVYKMHMQYS